MTTSINPANIHGSRANQSPSDVGGPNFLGNRQAIDNQNRTVAEEPASFSGHGAFVSQNGNAAEGLNLQHGQDRTVNHERVAVLDQTSPTPIETPLTTDAAVSGTDFQDHHSICDTQTPPVVLDDPLLGVLADMVNDLEAIRCATENRLRSLTNTGEHGHGLTLHNPDVARLAALCDSLKASEHQAILNMRRVMRRHPLWLWAQPIPGVGEKQFARLLAVIGDPYWNSLHDRPRRVSELRAYCGYHVVKTSGNQFVCDNQERAVAGQTSSGQQGYGPQVLYAAGSGSHTNHAWSDIQTTSVGVAPKRQRGKTSNWNEDARKRCFLIAESLMKHRSVYRDKYDATRVKYAGAVHNSPCVRCGPKGAPAAVGSQLSLGHQHARALRAVAKMFLHELWREAKRLHESSLKEEEN